MSEQSQNSRRRGRHFAASKSIEDSPAVDARTQMMPATGTSPEAGMSTRVAPDFGNSLEVDTRSQMAPSIDDSPGVNAHTQTMPAAEGSRVTDTHLQAMPVAEDFPARDSRTQVMPTAEDSHVANAHLQAMPTGEAHQPAQTDAPAPHRAGLIVGYLCIAAALIMAGLVGWLVLGSSQVGLFNRPAPDASNQTAQQREAKPPVEVADQQVVEEPAKPPVDPTLSGWVTGDDGERRYYDPQTHQLYGGWLEEDGATYYIDGDTGQIATGWIELEGSRYWLDDGSRAERGSLIRSTWLELDGARFYLDEDGSAQTGWHTIDGATYCFDDTGAMRTGWADGNDGKKRWLKYEDGTMASHEWVEVDGIWEVFGDDGAWIEGDAMVPPTNEQDMNDMTARQHAVVDACSYTPFQGKGWCAAWVWLVFANAGEPAGGGDACDIANAWCTSDDLSELKPGMVVAVPSHPQSENGKIWGHVCIYIGNGLVMDNGSTAIRTMRLGAWAAWFGATHPAKWGWNSGVSLI